MKLKLKWKDKTLGILEKIKDEYVFKIDEEELKEAIKNGCMGIGNLDLLQTEYRSNELFTFFKNRIPDRTNLNIKEILKEFNMEKYDEMELLKNTSAQLETDNYFVEEMEE